MLEPATVFCYGYLASATVGVIHMLPDKGLDDEMKEILEKALVFLNLALAGARLYDSKEPVGSAEFDVYHFVCIDIIGKHSLLGDILFLKIEDVVRYLKRIKNLIARLLRCRAVQLPVNDQRVKFFDTLADYVLAMASESHLATDIY